MLRRLLASTRQWLRPPPMPRPPVPPTLASLAAVAGLPNHFPEAAFHQDFLNRYGVVLHTPDALPLMNLDPLRERLMPILSAHYADHGGGQKELRWVASPSPN